MMSVRSTAEVGEDSPLIDRQAAKLALSDATKNWHDQAGEPRSFADREFDPAQIAFEGADVHNLPAMHRLLGCTRERPTPLRLPREGATMQCLLSA
jgi:hypothetical protein